jgi:DNA-directed RNA polymerase specialized sigma subunit
MYGYIIHEFYKSFDYYNRKNREINLESLQISYSQNDNMSTPATVAEQLKDDTIDIEEQVLDKIEYQDYLVKLHKALEVIPERSRLIIHEYYFNNKICKDISKIVNLNTNSVNRLKVQIVNELKQMITDPSYINVIKAKEEAKALGVLRNLPKNYEDFTHLLTKKEKIALDMKLEGKTYKDIALVLKINKHTTGSVLARVANKLNDASMRASGNCKTRDFYESLYNKYPKYLREISTSDQLLLNLKYKDKKKYSEIANILNRKETAVCVLIRNAEYRFGNVITSHEEI